MLLHGFGIRRIRGTGPYGWVGVYFRVREFWGACRVAGGMEPNARLRRECSGRGAVMVRAASSRRLLCHRLNESCVTLEQRQLLCYPAQLIVA